MAQQKRGPKVAAPRFLLGGARSSPLGAPYGSWGGAPATRGCPGVDQVAEKAAGSSLNALGVTFGPHLPASALGGVSGQRARHLRARARSPLLIQSWHSEL